MTGVVLIRWGQSIAGREAKGLEVFGKALEYAERLTKEGRLHGHREYFAVTGRDGGFILLEGEVEELSKIAYEPETLAFNARAAAIVEDFEVQLYGGGSDQAVQELMGQYVAALQEIGYL